MSKNNNIIWITRTAIFIALTVMLQALTLQLANQYITGSIVNMMLILSVMTCSFASGLTVAAVTPVLPVIMGFGPLPPLVPFIILGNMALVTAWHYIGSLKILRESKPGISAYISYFIALPAGAIVKFLILYAGIVKIAAPLILGLPGTHPVMTLFSIPQLITACAGGAAAIVVLPPLKKALGKLQ